MEVVTIREAAERLGVTVEEVRTRVKKGDFNSRRVSTPTGIAMGVELPEPTTEDLPQPSDRAERPADKGSPPEKAPSRREVAPTPDATHLDHGPTEPPSGEYPSLDEPQTADVSSGLGATAPAKHEGLQEHGFEETAVAWPESQQTETQSEHDATGPPSQEPPGVRMAFTAEELSKVFSPEELSAMGVTAPEEATLSRDDAPGVADGPSPESQLGSQPGEEAPPPEAPLDQTLGEQLPTDVLSEARAEIGKSFTTGELSRIFTPEELSAMGVTPVEPTEPTAEASPQLGQALIVEETAPPAPTPPIESPQVQDEDLDLPRGTEPRFDQETGGGEAVQSHEPAGYAYGAPQSSSEVSWRELVTTLHGQVETLKEELSARRREVQELHVLMQQLQSRALPPPNEEGAVQDRNARDRGGISPEMGSESSSQGVGTESRQSRKPKTSWWRSLWRTA